MATFVVRYTYSDNAAGRDERRPEHIDFLRAQYEAKRLLMSGPIVSDMNPGAMLIFAGESADDVATLLADEPFMRNGLVAARSIDEWKIFFGGIKDE